MGCVEEWVCLMLLLGQNQSRFYVSWGQARKRNAVPCKPLETVSMVLLSRKASCVHWESFSHLNIPLAVLCIPLMMYTTRQFGWVAL